MDKYKQPCPFEFKEMTCEEASASLEQAYKDRPWLVQDASKDESSSPMPGLSPKQEHADNQILQDQKTILNAVLALHNRMDRQDQNLREMMGELIRLSADVVRLAEALAEDQDPDEMPATYMDGSPV